MPFDRAPVPGIELRRVDVELVSVGRELARPAVLRRAGGSAAVGAACAKSCGGAPNESVNASASAPAVKRWSRVCIDGLLNGLEAYKSDRKMRAADRRIPVTLRIGSLFLHADGRRGGHKELE